MIASDINRCDKIGYYVCRQVRDTMADNKCEGSLYVQIGGKWKSVFCWIRNKKFQAFDKQRVVSVSTTNRASQRQTLFEVHSLRLLVHI